MFPALLWLTATPTALIAQPRLILRDSILLEQSGDSYIAQPVTLAADHGGYLVGDGQLAQVFRFDGRGELVQRYGSKGEGPGEFEEVRAALPYGAEDVIVFSWRPPAAQVFNRESGELVARYGLQVPIEGVAVRGERAWLSGIRYSTGSSLRRVVLGGPEDMSVSLIPTEYEEQGPLGGIFHLVPFTAWADTVLLGFEPLDKLFLVSPAGTVIDTLTVPALHRRGTPEEPTEALLEALERGPYPQVFGALSALRGLSRRGDGSFLLVHFDHRPAGPPVTSDLYVSVIDAGRTRACLDAAVPLGPESEPAIGFAGDDLLVLEQVLVGLEAVPVLRRFRVDASACDWSEIGE